LKGLLFRLTIIDRISGAKAEKPMSDKSEHNNLEGECTLPPDHPLPPDQLGRYSPERNYYAEKNIAEYVLSQAPDETVQNVELIKAEYILGGVYEIWDATTDKDRYWIVTNPTNLYSQRHFPSLDYTLSFHVGLTMRIGSRNQEGKPKGTPFDEVFRRTRQISELLEKAVEAVDFQAVGMQLRECLISLVATIRRRVEISSVEERPKDADVIGWNRLFVGHFCPGEKNDELRNYVKATTEKAWALVCWLTHHRNANKTAALIALDAVEIICNHYFDLLRRERADRVNQCPRCASRDIRTFFDMAIGPDGAYFETCGACDWDNHPGYPSDDDSSVATDESR
jgi:hypothetical protein